MRTWEDQAGYPNIHVEKIPGGFNLTQTRFGGGDEIYSVPISFTTLSDASTENLLTRHWLTTKFNILPSTDNWVLLNMQDTGYYRITYSNEIWDAMGQSLNNNFNQIAAVHRARILRDAASVLSGGVVTQTLGLWMIKPLAQESSKSL